MEKEQRTINLLQTIILFSALLVIVSCSSKETAKVSIELQGFENAKAVMEEQRVAGEKFLDSLTFSSSGKLKYKYDLDQPTFYNLRCNANKDFFFILQPGDKVSIKGAKDNLHIEGSEESEKLMFLYDSLYAVREMLSNIKADYQAAASEEEKNSLAGTYQSVVTTYKNFSKKFVLENLHSLVSLAALYQETDQGEFVFGTNRDLQFFKLVTDSLTKYYPRHRHVLALKRNYNQMMQNYNMNKIMAAADNIEEGLPELELPTFYGDKISLTAIKERYVLLNFWSLRSISENNYLPSLKSLHGRFSKKGFEIYNVYLGKSVDRWKKTIDFEEIDHFINVADTSFPFSKTQGSYNITALPTNYLLDLKENEIIGKNMPVDELKRRLAIKLE